MKKFFKKRQGKTKSKPEIVAFAPHPSFHFEAYIYQHNPTNDGHTAAVQKFGKGELEYDTLTEAGFTTHKFRRQPGRSNQIAKNEGNGFWRIIFLREIEESTTETRRKGKDCLEAFLVDPRNTRYPQDSIEYSDLGGGIPLDSFFLDDDIKEMLKENFEESDLDETFYTKFPEFARICWDSDHNCDFADSLGIPRGM